jgi:Zn-dependent peptidase ImmA (M78 family)
MNLPELRVERWLSDPTRRFSLRPVFRSEDLNSSIEEFVSNFLGRRNRTHRYPVLDDDLERLVDGLTSDFDSSCDLRFVGDDVEGATRFWFDRKPAIMIDSRLIAANMARRRRMTIAHELGHVLLHRQLFERSASGMMELFPDLEDRAPVYCFRHGIDLGPNWMEWQASYVAGLILMPSREVIERATAIAREKGIAYPFSANDDETDQLIMILSSEFEISQEATRVRLLQLHSIEPHSAIQRLPLS